MRGLRREADVGDRQDALRHHGDREVDGLIDFAVNVFPLPRPEWLDAALRVSLNDLHRYPDAGEARAAIAQRHGRDTDEVLPTAGGAEAFTLIARARPWKHPLVVHPQFTEPEAALVTAGHTVDRVILDGDFTLDPARVPEAADLVTIGNPTNPTGVLHPADAILSLLRPGRVVVVDEAFMDAVPGEPESLTSTQRDGLLVVRSLTKTWSVPGVRAGYVVGDREVLHDLARQQPPWSVSTPSLAVLLATASPGSPGEATTRAALIEHWRTLLIEQLPLPVAGDPRTPFVLVRGPLGLREKLRDEGFAVRRGDTFPGLGPEWVRIAVRPPEETGPLIAAIEKVLS
ncbi:MAG TPA: Rv2231c family pyridoxal phosphate-dependent protein CobC [Nocardioidaceae bacterium]|nr:Rv2231c family pyridoxal phosphate-dependent protein CobC [Nocardioidaceae bacterium]